MITNPEVARRVSALMLECSANLHASVDDVRASCPDEEFENYRRAVAGIMAEMLLTVMNPIYAAHPSLKPAGLE